MLFKAVLTHAAHGTFKALRDLAPRRTWRYASFGIAGTFIVFPTANAAYILHGNSSFLIFNSFRLAAVRFIVYYTIL